jgi:hypothetical protein
MDEDEPAFSVSDLPDEVRDALESWLGMGREDAQEFVDLFLGATRITTDYDARRAILTSGIVAQLVWRQVAAPERQILLAHSAAQAALLKRIAEVASDADAASLAQLADAYMALPRPGEDDFSALRTPPLPEPEEPAGSPVDDAEGEA